MISSSGETLFLLVDSESDISTLIFICEMKCRNLIMTVCKQAHRNLKLQTNIQLCLVWSTEKKKFECIMIFQDDEWPGKEMTISEEY